MKVKSGLIVLLILVAIFSSCATVNTPVAATTNELGPLVGQSSGTIWFGIFGNADAGIQAACQDGKIVNISTVDFEYKMVALGLGKKYTCTVTGK